MESFTLLIVEDEGAELNRLERGFERLNSNINVLKASTAVSALNQFRRHVPEVVVLDLGLTGHGPKAGLELISKLAAFDPTARIIVLTGHVGDDVAVDAVKNGAASFLTKPANATVLHTLVQDYAQTARFRRNGLYPDIVQSLPGFVGSSPAMKNVYRLINQAAAMESNVLIVGETGSGKELVAKAIHELSGRRNCPLSVYFGSVPGSMAEAELFGYVRGAFTGAGVHGTEGSVKKAHLGTLFIDELDSLDLDIQRKLLRTIEEKTFKPLGADNYHKSDFRLICAAQPRLYDLVRSGQFREDLLARIEVLTIHVPPLRERREDIVPLSEWFFKSIKEELDKAGLPCSVWGFTKAAYQLFREYSWPRNVRELKNVIHNATVQAQLRGSEKIDVADIRISSSGAEEQSDYDVSGVAASLLSPGVTLQQAVEKLEQIVITASLKRNERHINAVCQELGLGRTTLWRKLRSYRLGDGA